jgi:hypothetical protein
MNISLRRAAALQNSIQDALREIALVRSIKLNEFQDAETQLSQARAAHAAGVAVRGNLTQVLYQIRRAVGQANAQAGINDRLTEVAQLDRDIQFYSELASSQPRESAEVIAGRLNRIRTSTNEQAYYREPVVESSVFDARDVQEFRQRVAQQRRARQTLQDQILALNVSTEITLGDNEVLILQSANLL